MSRFLLANSGSIRLPKQVSCGRQKMRRLVNAFVDASLCGSNLWTFAILEPWNPKIGQRLFDLEIAKLAEPL
jgi:hypothetical protein